MLNAFGNILKGDWDKEGGGTDGLIDRVRLSLFLNMREHIFYMSIIFLLPT